MTEDREGGFIHRRLIKNVSQHDDLGVLTLLDRQAM